MIYANLLITLAILLVAVEASAPSRGPLVRRAPQFGGFGGGGFGGGGGGRGGGGGGQGGGGGGGGNGGNNNNDNGGNDDNGGNGGDAALQLDPNNVQDGSQDDGTANSEPGQAASLT